ncbi:MAG: MinD/ParA family protein [Actinomycetota bacterium]|nr:MinD/ParA family protein [Actinomycetota bacterium]
MANAPGTEQAAEDSADHTDSDADIGRAPWPAPKDETAAGRDPVEGSEQIRITDADRWAASFASIGGQQDTPGSRNRPEDALSHVVPLSNDQPLWSTRAPIPAPPAEPSWRNAGSASGCGQASSVANHSQHSPSHADPPVQPWTTDVPSGFDWSSDTLARTEEATPPQPPPPPPPAGYPSQTTPAPRQQDTGQSYGPPPFGGPYGGQQSEPPGSQSHWAADTAVAPPSPTPPQQWTPQSNPGQGWQPTGQQAPPMPQHMSAAALNAGSLVKPAAAVPRVGWRKMVHAVTGGAVNPGLSQAEQNRRNLIERATAPVRGCHRIAVVSLKGGIGKTTTTAGLGLTLAEHRGDRVVALDANPDAGTLAERLTGQVEVTVRDLLDNLDSIRSFTDVSSFTSLAARLQVLASEQDPEMSEAFSEVEYRTVADVLARYFNIVLTDSGTGLLHSAMSGTLAIADSLVVVGSPSVDGASRASKTLDWLIAHGHGELVSRAVAIISTVRPASKELDMLRLRDHFLSRVRAVVEIPYDRHLVTGGIIDMTQLDGPTEQSFLELSAIVADGFRLPPLSRPHSTH